MQLIQLRNSTTSLQLKLKMLTVFSPVRSSMTRYPIHITLTLHGMVIILQIQVKNISSSLAFTTETSGIRLTTGVMKDLRYIRKMMPSSATEMKNLQITSVYMLTVFLLAEPSLTVQFLRFQNQLLQQNRL